MNTGRSDAAIPSIQMVCSSWWVGLSIFQRMLQKKLSITCTTEAQTAVTKREKHLFISIILITQQSGLCTK